jgi:hypothetical protein
MGVGILEPLIELCDHYMCSCIIIHMQEALYYTTTVAIHHHHLTTYSTVQQGQRPACVSHVWRRPGGHVRLVTALYAL